MQRLFSNFANGWPGAGLLLQRLLAGLLLLHDGITPVLEKPSALAKIPEMIGAGAGALLLLGLWTPVAGIVVAVMEVWVLLMGLHQPSIPMMVATLGISIAMIGPGACSLDARIFGRKHIAAVLPSKSSSGPFH